MNITSQPTLYGHVSRKPLIFTVTGAGNTERMVASVGITGALGAATFTVNRTYKNAGVFTFDFSQVMSEYFNETHKTFNAIGGSNAANTDRWATMSVTFTEWNKVAGAYGDILEEGANIVSTAVIVLNADLPYTQSKLTTNQQTGKQFLTTKRRGIIKLGTTEYLSAYKLGGSSCVVNYYGHSGFIGFVNVSLGTSLVNSFNIGAIIPSNVTWLEVIPEATDANKIVYVVVDCEVFPIHFVNSLGQVDTMMFKRRSSAINVKSGSYERKYPISSVDALDIGLGRYTVSGLKEYKYYATNLKKAEMDWLQEITMSRYAAIEENGVYIPCIIADSNSMETDTEKKLYTSVITVQTQITGGVL